MTELSTNSNLVKQQAKSEQNHPVYTQSKSMQKWITLINKMITKQPGKNEQIQRKQT